MVKKLETKDDVLSEISKYKKRLEEAKRTLKYLEKENAPKTRITEMKRIVNFIEQEHNTRYLAFKLTELAFKDE